MKITEIDEKNYKEEILASKRPAIAYFWAPWCKFCSLMTPRFEKIADSFRGDVKFCRINIDKNEPLAKKNNLKGIPTIILYHGGREVGRIMGVEDEDVLLEKIESHLGDYY
jgi:thioredoxin